MVRELDQSSIVDLLYLGAFFLGGLFLALAPMLMAYLLSPRSTRNYLNKTGQPIECGMETIGDAWIRFGVVYHLYALIFIAFSVDVLYLLPVALVYNTMPGVPDLLELLIFVGILFLVLIYALKKGVFTWTTKLSPSQR